jgi:hypothetical protein
MQCGLIHTLVVVSFLFFNHALFDFSVNIANGAGERLEFPVVEPRVKAIVGLN